MRAYERLLNYVVVRTPSDEHSTTSPSSQCQFDLARILADEMTALGISDVTLDEFCYVYGSFGIWKMQKHGPMFFRRFKVLPSISTGKIK